MSIQSIKFGIEIETSVPLSANINVGPYHHGNPVARAMVLHEDRTCTSHVAPTFKGAQWRAECDASIAPARNHVACEFVSPILEGEEGVQHLIDFVAWLNRIGAKVNNSCGLHIHIGVESFNAETPSPIITARFVKILSRLATRNATALYAQTGTLSREQGHFCRRAGAEVRKTITRACRKKNAASLATARLAVDRYQLLNLTNLATRHTVEFRCFAGTLNIDKILCHLVSVFLLCKVAAGRKSLTNWDPSFELSGTEALHNLLKVRPTFAILGAPVLSEWRERILNKGFEMAAKYDEAKAANRARQAGVPSNTEILAQTPAQALHNGTLREFALAQAQAGNINADGSLRR